ncbi:MAG: HAD family hydrolase [Succinivibrionaceae bacterium]
MNSCKSLLFDLDGTLIDTWEDLKAAADFVLKNHGYSATDSVAARLKATDGMVALLSISMGSDISLFSTEQLKKEFLDYYLQHIRIKSRLFPGMEEVLAKCRQLNIPWGIVTNKPAFLTRPLINAFADLSDCAVTVCGDQVKEKKPHGESLFTALKILHIKPQDTVYVGDHIRDIQCGNNAGTATAAAGWGYINHHNDINQWPADFFCRSPLDLLDIITGKIPLPAKN